MKISEISVGQRYEVSPPKAAHFLVRNEALYEDGEPVFEIFTPAQSMESHFRHLPHGRRDERSALVVEKGLPYGKNNRLTGVRVEFTFSFRRPCPTCHEGGVYDEDGEPIYDERSFEAIIPASMVLGPWDQKDIRRDLDLMEYEAAGGRFDIRPEHITGEDYLP